MKTALLNIVVTRNNKEQQEVAKALLDGGEGVLNKHTIIMPKKLFDEFLTKAGKNWFKIMEKSGEKKCLK